MAISPIELVGLAASCLTTPSFILQAIRIIRIHNTQAISLGMYSLFAAGTALWVAYGIALGSPGLIIGNTITLIFVLIILVMKIKLG